jgi:hypothetical protein
VSIRVVLYAEGALEAGVFRAPFGDELAEDEQGPAHVLVRRCIAAARTVPEPAVRFHRPQRTGRGLVPRGSLLLDRTTVRRLLSFPPGRPRPEVGIVLVDADGDPARQRLLEELTRDLAIRVATAVAIQEFEAWLIADDTAVAAASGRPFPTQRAPESMKPREAKQVLREHIAGCGTEDAVVRRTIASRCDLAVVGSRCPAFEAFRAALA